MRYRAKPRETQLIHAAYMGWRSHLNGPMVQSRFSTHQLRRTYILQKCRPNPMQTIAAPRPFISDPYGSIDG